MAVRKASPLKAGPVPAFNAQAFLDSSGIAKTIVEYGRGETIFTQGDPSEDVLYIQAGGVKLSALERLARAQFALHCQRACR